MGCMKVTRNLIVLFVILLSLPYPVIIGMFSFLTCSIFDGIKGSVATVSCFDYARFFIQYFDQLFLRTKLLNQLMMMAREYL